MSTPSRSADSYPRDVPDEQHLARIMAQTGVTADEAGFILRLERGEIDGDVELRHPDSPRPD